MDLKLMLEETVSQYGDKTAIVCGERRVSYAEVDKTSNKVAHALIKMGLRKDDRVAMLLTNSPEFVAIYFGIIKAGGIPVPMDVRYRIGELASLFASCQPKILAGESEFLELLAPDLPRFQSITHVIELDSRFKGQFFSYHEIMVTSSAQKVDVKIDPEDIGVISYTGGPTSRPCGSVLNHRSMVAEALSVAEGLQQTDKDVTMLFALPMYHMFGLESGLLTSVCKGSTVVIVPGTGRSITSFLAAIEKERGTIYFGVPYIYALAINIAEKEGVRNDLSSLRLWGSGGATLTVGIRQQFKQFYGADIHDVWGLTESVSHITYHPLDGMLKLDSTGKALPGWEIAAADDDDNKLPPNQVGEIIVRGPLMQEYYHNPQDTAKIIKDGWLYTGDIGKIDEDGYLYLSGMKKNMIILKGQNVYPIDIEEVLCAHPKVAEAVVVGIPDKLRGEIVGAIIRLKRGVETTEQEIRRFCQARLADYKLPKQIIFTRSLLKNTAGKIGKKSLEDFSPHLAQSLPSSHQ